MNELPVLTLEFYKAASPIFILAIAAMVLMMQSVFKGIGSVGAVRAVLYVSLALSAFGILSAPGGVEEVFLDGSFLSQAIARFGSFLILVIAIVVCFLFSATYLRDSFFRGEVAALFAMVVMGMLVMISADELISVFTGLEIASIGIYALIGYIHPTRRSIEGAVKYLVLGSFATGFLLMGLALLYAGSGSLRITEIVASLGKVGEHSWIRLGGLFVLVGFGFKLALVPFHLWAPDAYEGAPTGMTAFMATAVKVMILIVTLRFMVEGLAQMNSVWPPALMFLAILSMIVGNVMALVQSSLKRMLAYSSIAHSGYIAVAICAIGFQSGELPAAAVLFYLTGYTVISLGAFGILMWLETHEIDNLQLDDLAGIAKKHPLASFALAGFMFSFAGFPPTVGFLAKFFVFSAALGSELYSLAIIGAIGSSISLYYYLRVIVKMYMSSSVPTAAALCPKPSWTIGLIAGSALVLNLILGTVSPGQLMNVVKGSVRSLQTK